LADLQQMVYSHSGHPSAEGRAQDRVSSPAKDWRTDPDRYDTSLNGVLAAVSNHLSISK